MQTIGACSALARNKKKLEWNKMCLKSIETRHLSVDGDNLHLSGTVMVLEVEGLLATLNNPKKNLAFALL